MNILLYFSNNFSKNDEKCFRTKGRKVLFYVKRNCFMKKNLNTLCAFSLTFLFIGFLIFAGCSQGGGGGKKNSIQATSPVIYPTMTPTITTTPSPTPTSSSSTCDGVFRTGATSCYYKVLPTFVYSGSGVAGFHYWASNVDLPSNLDPNIFRTDANFAVRIRPVVVDGGTSKQGRTCSQYTKNNFSKLQVKLMLRRTTDSVSSNIQTLVANVNSYSNVGRFVLPGGTTAPYVLEVHSILSNHRCNSTYGTPPTGCPNSFYDIPVVTGTYPTDCVGFELEFATDSTYDFP